MVPETGMKQCILVCGHVDECEAVCNCLRSIWKAMGEIVYPVVVVINGVVDADMMISSKCFIEGLACAIGYKAYVFFNEKNSWECGCLQTVLAQTDYDEFFFLPSTTEIKDAELFKMVFQEHCGQSVAISGSYRMYMGKYLRKILEQIEFPVVNNKLDAVKEYEGKDGFIQHYLKKCSQDESIVLFPAFCNEQRIENRFGRKNRIYENEYLKRYQGHWMKGMCAEKC